jgi:hypothetical protein
MTETVAYEQGQEFLMEIFHDVIAPRAPYLPGANNPSNINFAHHSESNDSPGKSAIPLEDLREI